MEACLNSSMNFVRYERYIKFKAGVSFRKTKRNCEDGLYKIVQI